MVGIFWSTFLSGTVESGVLRYSTISPSSVEGSIESTTVDKTSHAVLTTLRHRPFNDDGKRVRGELSLRTNQLGRTPPFEEQSEHLDAIPLIDDIDTVITYLAGQAKHFEMMASMLSSVSNVVKLHRPSKQFDDQPAFTHPSVPDCTTGERSERPCFQDPQIL